MQLVEVGKNRGTSLDRSRGMRCHLHFAMKRHALDRGFGNYLDHADNATEGKVYVSNILLRYQVM